MPLLRRVCACETLDTSAMTSKRTVVTVLWPVAIIVCLFVFVSTPVIAAPVQPEEQAVDVEVHLLSSTERSAFPDGGDEERTGDGKIRDDVVPLDSAEERGKFLTTLLMLEDLQEGRPGAKIGHPERLQSDEEVMSEVFKLYQNQAFSGKHYLKIPPKLMKKMKRKLKELMSE